MRLTSTFRVSHALTISVVACVLGVAGTAIAQRDATDTSRSEKNAPKLSKQQVKRIAQRQIRQTAPTLSVLQAERAGVAASSETAVNVNGVGVGAVRFQLSQGQSGEKVFESQGLVVRAACSSGAISLTASTSRPAASIYTSFVSTNTNNNNWNADIENGGFGAGTTFDLLAGSGGGPGIVSFGFIASGDQPVPLTGTILVDGCQAHGHTLSGLAPQPVQ